MESARPYDQDNQQQPTTSQPIIFPQPTSTSEVATSSGASSQQNSYQVKCNLLEYHIQEAILINKALRSEVNQYKDKIDFEKKLRKFLVTRVKGIES